MMPHKPPVVAKEAPEIKKGIHSGQELKDLRLRLKLTRAAFAEIIGYSEISIYFLETGRRRITPRLQASLRAYT